MKGQLQRALAYEGTPTLFGVQTASRVTGFVNTPGVYEAFGEPRRTLIIDLDAVTDDEGVIREPFIGALHSVAHQVDAYLTVIRISEAWEAPDARLLTDLLPAWQYADITVARDGAGFVVEVAAASHYRRSEEDTVTTLRGPDERFWDAFDACSWMLGTPTAIVSL